MPIYCKVLLYFDSRTALAARPRLFIEKGDALSDSIRIERLGREVATYRAANGEEKMANDDQMLVDDLKAIDGVESLPAFCGTGFTIMVDATRADDDELLKEIVACFTRHGYLCERTLPS